MTTRNFLEEIEKETWRGVGKKNTLYIVQRKREGMNMKHENYTKRRRENGGEWAAGGETQAYQGIPCGVRSIYFLVVLDGRRKREWERRRDLNISPSFILSSRL